MSDIVQRLRETDQGFGLAREAADEIERLRGENKWLRACMREHANDLLDKAR